MADPAAELSRIAELAIAHLARLSEGPRMVVKKCDPCGCAILLEDYARHTANCPDRNGVTAATATLVLRDVQAFAAARDAYLTAPENAPNVGELREQCNNAAYALASSIAYLTGHHREARK